MYEQTLAPLESALDAVPRDLSSRVEELADRSTAGAVTPEEQSEYAEIVRLNDTLRLQAEDLSIVRAAS